MQRATSQTGGYLPAFTASDCQVMSAATFFAVTSYEEDAVHYSVPGVCADVLLATAEYPHQHVYDIRVFMP